MAQVLPQIFQMCCFRLRHILSLKMLLALFFVLGLFAIAVVTSVGAAVYCEHQKAVWKEANETVTYPGLVSCRRHK